jgi:hypothetical protein
MKFVSPRLCAGALLLFGKLCTVAGQEVAGQEVAGAITGAIAGAILKAAASKMISLATEEAMKSLGLGPTTSLENLKEELEGIQSSIDTIENKIDEQNLKEALRSARVTTAKARTEASVVSGWLSAEYIPSGTDATNMFRRVSDIMETMEDQLVNSDYGVIPMFLQADSYSKVSDLLEYHHDLDELRKYFANSLVSTVSTFETLARIMDTAAHKCNDNGQDSLTLINTSSTERKLNTNYSGKSGAACRLDTAGHGGPKDPLAGGTNNKYFRVAPNTYSQQSCQQKCNDDDDCTAFEYGSNNKRCELWKLPVGWMKPTSGYSCYIKPNKSYNGQSGTACRLDSAGHGGPKDPLAGGTNNKYFRIAPNTNNQQSCQQKCTNDDNCTAFEYGSNNKRCELWKLPVGWVQPVYGYSCYIKPVVPAPTPMPTPDPNKCNDSTVYTFTDDQINDFFQKAKRITKDMYRVGGVPLVEGRNYAKFVHVRDEPWALSPLTSFSGYYGTSTTSRLGSKLDTMVKEYEPEKNYGKSLEQFLNENGVPTDYIAQNTWKCGNKCGPGGCDYGTYVIVTVMRIKGNQKVQKEVSLPGDCSNMKVYKRDAGRDGKGLYLANYYENACFDPDLCDTSDLGNPTIVNRSFHGRFFTYNLTGDDCNRMCKSGRCTQCGPFTKGCDYCGNRLNDGGRAMLRSEKAVTDYIGW